MDTKQKIEVMKAFLEGKTIECRSNVGMIPIIRERGVPVVNDWINVRYAETNSFLMNKEPSWNWVYLEYRVKQEPREFVVAYREDTGKLVGLAESTSNFVKVEASDVEMGKIKVMRVREVLE